MKKRNILENTYSELPETFYSFQKPEPVEEPNTALFNEALAKELGLEFLNKDDIPLYFSGNKIFEDTQPIAQAYAGHQFGHFNMLGDGRAVLLGEHITPERSRIDIQLKGSGQTPYSRRGDGRATLYSMLREYLISEAMHHLGIPTTRSLAVVSTGEQVYRGGASMGGVLTRTAASHIRVGTFEYARGFGSQEDLKALLDYTIDRHYPEIQNSENPALELFKKLIDKQTTLIVEWMRVGFIHGVMNTDNMSISGESIDYGPCAFINSYSPKTVFSSIDEQGRYSFGNQRPIGRWNLTAFANAILPLISESGEKAVELAQEDINKYEEIFDKKWYAMMFKKLGVANPIEEDKSLVDELLNLMEEHHADYTQTFLALEQKRMPDGDFYRMKVFNDWKKKWAQTYLRENKDKPNIKLMRASNPRVIPRNHWVENALENAAFGEMQPFNDLLKLLTNPYGDHADEVKFQEMPKDIDEGYMTFCGT